MSLPTRQLGRNGPHVTALGIGVMGLSAFYGTKLPDEQRFAFLDACYEAGELMWDSANAYGDNEDLIGEWFKKNPGKREKVFLATKFALKSKDDGTLTIDSSPQYAKSCIDKSLSRLGLPYVDLYYCHRLDKETPVEETVKAMAEMKEQGKIKHIGLSECSAQSLRRAQAVHPIACVQIEYSPWSLDIEDPQVDLLRTCRELGVGVVAYSPIGRGMVSGAIRSRKDLEEGDFRLSVPRWSEENFHKNLELTDKITAMAHKKGVTATQLTLAWILAQGEDIIPIPGTTKIERLKENLGALKVQLSKTEQQEIRDACENAEVRGDRYASVVHLFADTPPMKA